MILVVASWCPVSAVSRALLQDLLIPDSKIEKLNSGSLTSPPTPLEITIWVLSSEFKHLDADEVPPLMCPYSSALLLSMTILLPDHEDGGFSGEIVCFAS
jgi:hypothetical protein